MKKQKNILVIEDDPHIAELLEIHLKDAGFGHDLAADGETGLQKALSGEFDLVILDIMLPDTDGFEVCKAIRKAENYIPVLMLTSKSEELDKVLGLEIGADDYITKPFSIREFLARIKAVFRRLEQTREPAQSREDADVLDFGELVIDMNKKRVTIDGAPVELTAKEFELLALFARKPGRTFSRKELLDVVWGYQFTGYDHTVNSHINRLRNKIEKDPANPVYIQTVWGMGYRFVELEEVE